MSFMVFKSRKPKPVSSSEKYGRLIADLRKNAGRHNDLVIHLLEKYASALSKEGNYRDAASTYEEIYKFHSKNASPGITSTVNKNVKNAHLHLAIRALEQRAEQLIKSADYASAFECFKKCADIHFRLDDKLDAVEKYTRASEIASSAAMLGSREHFLNHAALTMKEAGIILNSMEQYNDAIKKLENAMKIYSKLAGEAKPSSSGFILDSRDQIASINSLIAEIKEMRSNRA